jgi:isopenicillin-N N-acyltransferase-like protein
MFHHLKLKGHDPHSWGLQHGEALRTHIQELNSIRKGLLRTFLKGWSQDQIDDLCRDHIHTLERCYPRLHQECLGIAKASEVSLEDIIALNAYTDLRDFSAQNTTSRAEEGCSIVAVKGPKANYAAQTWDMHGSATPYMLLIEVEDPHPMWILTVTGCLGLTGLNQHGLSVMINNMHCRETNRKGLLWPGLVRLMLSQKNSSEAAECLAKNIPSSGHNYLLFDPDEAINIETTGLQWERTDHIRSSSKPRFSFHTNHYVGSLKRYEILERQSPTTHKRYQALQDYCTDAKALSVDAQELRQKLFIEGSLCKEICIPQSSKDPHAGATCGGLEIDHLARKATAFKGLWNDQKHISWSF